MMEIKKEYLEGGREIDFTANFIRGSKKGRVSLRKKDNKYQIYVKWYLDGKEEILLESTDLRECINFTNNLFGYDDVVIEG